MNKKWILPTIIMIFMMFHVTVNVFASENVKYDEAISYIYIDSPELETGYVQNIGIVLKDGMEASDFELIYKSQTTNISYIARAVLSVDGAVLFRLYPGNSVDTYTVTQFRYRDDAGEKIVTINDDNFVFYVTEEMLETDVTKTITKTGIAVDITGESVSDMIADSLEEISESMPKVNAAKTNNIVIALDPGHDSYHSGTMANGICEEIVTLKLAEYAKAELETYEGVTVYMTRTGAQCPYTETIGKASSYDIQKRVDAAVAKGAQAVISFHLNSYTSASANGCLVLCPKGNNSIAIDALELSDEILEKLCSVGFKNQGTRQEDWAITSYSYKKGIPGIIIEHGFVTNPDDAAKLKDESYLQKMGIADVTGIAEYYGLKKKTNSDGNSNPSTMVEAKKGILAQGLSEYLKNGSDVSDDEKNRGGIAERFPYVKIGVPANVQYYKIMGDSNVTVEQMAAFYNTYHKNDYLSGVMAAGGAATIEEFCQILLEEANAEGVRAEVVFAQAILETGWLRFGGVVQPESYNFCGLGAIDGAPGKAACFADVRTGLRAQVQHLKAYGSTEELKNACVDPRFSYVKRGCAIYIQWLGTKENPSGYGWSTQEGYGDDLMSLINNML